MVPIIMAASGWGAAYSVDRLQRRTSKNVLRAWPLSFLALLLGFEMFTAGFPKLITGWLNLSTHAAQGHFVLNYLSGRHDFLAPLFLHFQNPVFWELVDEMTVLLELGFIAAILSRQSLRLFCAASVLFHLSILLIMNIDFTPNVIAYAAFVDWAAVLRYLRLSSSSSRPIHSLSLIASRFSPWIGTITLLTGLAVFSCEWIGGAPLLPAFLQSIGVDPLVSPLFVMVPASALASFYLVHSLWSGIGPGAGGHSRQRSVFSRTMAQFFTLRKSVC
jgi:hypothetical protein